MSFLERFRALALFLGAAAWFLFSDLIADRAAQGLNFDDAQELLYRVFLLFLLILGYGVMARLGRRKPSAAAAMGLPARPGRAGEFALGAALGWAAVIALLLPAVLAGSLAVTAFTSAHQFFVAALDLIALAAGTLAIEVAFRGYGFYRLVDAMGPALATLFMALFFAVWRTHGAETTTASLLVSFFLGWALALASLRTRAVWLSWGLHFAWIASMAMLFGLPVAGPMSYSPILATNARGPAWITGGFQGPEGSAFAVIVSFLLVSVVVRATTELKHKYGYPEIVPGGIPVDLDAAARRQHEAAMAPATPQEPSLVQILPAQPLVAPRQEPDTPQTPDWPRHPNSPDPPGSLEHPAPPENPAPREPSLE